MVIHSALPRPEEPGAAVGVGTAEIEGTNVGDSTGSSADRLSNSRTVSSSLHWPLSTNWNISLSVRVGVGISGAGVNNTGVFAGVGVSDGVARGAGFASLSGLGTLSTGPGGTTRLDGRICNC